jgi:acetylornithine/succinyldiaminopimelate/putrescine aminotransferase
MSHSPSIFETWNRLLTEQIPNFLRLYLAPSAVQTCCCLNRYVQEVWFRGNLKYEAFQSFLANSFDEALSGAMKLARFSAGSEQRPQTGLILDPNKRIGSLVELALANQAKLAFIPDVSVWGAERLKAIDSPAQIERFGFVVAFPSIDSLTDNVIRVLNQASTLPPIIACMDRESLRQGEVLRGFPKPSIVVFDESFVRSHVPFGAFTARRSLYNYWNKGGFANFHSTTFQPNAVSTLHFMQCIQEDDPEFYVRHSEELERIQADVSYRKQLFRKLYSPSLARAASFTGWDRKTVRASGHYVCVDSRPVFDAVAGVACSIRGHNPPGFCNEIADLAGLSDYHQAVSDRLQQLTGLPNMLPAVSGASAVENALRLGLVAGSPRDFVLAFQGGFGGKTLFALTGTANARYKRQIEPLYRNVVYIDPFRADAVELVEKALAAHPVGVVQVELVQAVGGVRPLPEKLLMYLQDARVRFGFSLFVDEVQTGMYRTGPFLRSQALGLEPDIITLGKGTSDMMYPFAAVLFSDKVRSNVGYNQAGIIDTMRARLDYEFGYKTLLNVLHQAEKLRLAERVPVVARLIENRLRTGLRGCKSVRDVRVFGLLIAIELEKDRGLHRWLGNQVGPAYLLNLLRHGSFPVLAGFCQYEPHVLKLTPPLTITDQEAVRMCDTIVHVLTRPAVSLLPSLVGAISKTLAGRR